MPDRIEQIVEAARALIEEGGSQALTMRATADRLGIRAPSLYKHFPDKLAVEAGVIAIAMDDLAAELTKAESLAELAAAYRAYALEHPHLYRLMNSGPLPRHLLPAGAEDRAALPLVRVAGNDETWPARFGRSPTAWSSWNSTADSRPGPIWPAPGAPD